MSLNERYTFAAAEGAPMLLHSTDHAGSVNTFRNRVLITDQNGTGTPLKIQLNSSAYVNGPNLHLEQNGTGDAGIFYDDGSVYWSTGVDSSEGTEFRWANSNGLGANVRMQLDTSGNLTTGTLTLYKDDDTDNSLVEMLKLERHADDISNNANAEGGYIGLYVTDDNSGLGEGARITWRAENTPDTGEDDVKLSFSTLNDDTLSERMTINAVGNVGIGTTAPSNKLQVSHTGADADNGIMIVREDTTTVAGEILGGIGFDSTDGNVPSSILEASSFIAAYAAESHGTGDKGGYLTFGNSKINDNDDTVSTEHMRINDTGKVSIGDSMLNTYMLDVHDADSSPIRTTGTEESTAYSYRGIIVDNTGVGENAKMYSLRNATATALDETLYIKAKGDVHNDNNVYSATSDIRLKENIIEIYSGSNERNYQDDLMGLRVRKFSFKKANSEVPTHIGLIADEVEEVFPGLVDTATGATKLLSGSTYIDDPKSIKYSVLNMMLLKGYQELVDEVKTLKAQISGSSDYSALKANVSGS